MVIVMRKQKWIRCVRVERLESRQLLAAAIDALPNVDYLSSDVFPMIVAGELPDSPGGRVDPNVTTSPFAGVGSIQISTRRGSYICTGTPINRTHVVTAAHCLDINSDGKVNNKDGVTGVKFNLNYSGDLSHTIAVSSYVVHPDFTGFARPSVNDDVAVLTLNSAIPLVVPTYPMFTGDLQGSKLDMVGYGQSGSGTSGYTVNASFVVKRKGQNTADQLGGQDDANRPAAPELFRFDFDGPSSTFGNGTMGAGTLGNLLETTLGGGDSGGPSFFFNGTNYLLAGINTYTQNTQTASAPKFGSQGGGMNVSAYASWINSVISGAATSFNSAIGTTNNSVLHGINVINFEFLQASPIDIFHSGNTQVALTKSALQNILEINPSQVDRVMTDFAPKTSDTSLSANSSQDVSQLRRNVVSRSSSKSPRSALPRSLAVNRARIVCNSSSEICPFNPNNNRPLIEVGS